VKDRYGSTAAVRHLKKTDIHFWWDAIGIGGGIEAEDRAEA